MKAINIVITAGGTIEQIDAVRSIANTSTGRLGATICKNMITFMEDKMADFDYTIHYIVSKSAIKPYSEQSKPKEVIYYEISDTLSVKACVENVLEHHVIDYFVHSMAISDFMVGQAVGINGLINEITKGVEKTFNNRGLDQVRAIVESALINSNYQYNRDYKISSKEDAVILLQRTPKIIHLVKSLSQNTYLVGFKLLNNVSEEELIQVASQLGLKNNCDLVLANDACHIDEKGHKGLLLKDGQVINRCNDKEEIAKAIIREMFRGLNK